MGKVNTRTKAARLAAQIASEKRKRRRRNSQGECEEPDSQSGGTLSEGALSAREPQERGTADYTPGSSESESDSEVLLSEEEDTHPAFVGQPAEGWEEAERQLNGYSKSRDYRQKRSYHKHKDEIKRRREEKQKQKQGIAVVQKAKPIWGDISKMFNPNPKPSPEVLNTPPPADWSAPALMVPPGPPSTWGDPCGPSLEAFLSHQSFEEEARDLELWLKQQGGKVTGDWLTRVECLRDLLNMQFKNISQDQDGKRKDWIAFSEFLARRVKRSTKWAASLRLWERNWYETRTPPPCPRQGRHVKRQSLFDDEGVALAVREYLNTAMWHASPKGICDAVAAHLQSKNAA
ncbi:hypothetical protein FN846DRAFT_978478, partial [Sphaerosporella brunnea]